MKLPIKRIAPLAACAALLFAIPARAAGLGDPVFNIPQRLVESSLSQEVAAGDARVAAAQAQLQSAAKATGETEEAVAQACMRNARYIYDSSRLRATPLEVLEALAKHAPAGRPLTETTQRYVELRVKQKLDHAAALKQLAARR